MTGNEKGLWEGGWEGGWVKGGNVMWCGVLKVESFPVYFGVFDESVVQ